MSNHTKNPVNLKKVADAAFADGIQLGQVFEFRLQDSGPADWHGPIGIRSLSDFLDEHFGPPGYFYPIRTDRCYLGIVHEEGAYLVEL